MESEEKKQQNGKNNKKSGALFLLDALSVSFETIKIIIISLIVIIGIRSFIAQPFFVSGASMEPNFYDGDYLIVDEVSYKINEPNRGDVIIFRFPMDTREFYIKRIVGLPGEKIEIKNNKIIIYRNEYKDGLMLNEDYIPEGIATTGDYVIELKNDEYYVLGDNRIASSDSRVWGVLEKRFIIGRAWLRAWPFDSFYFFEVPVYLNPADNI